MARKPAKKPRAAKKRGRDQGIALLQRLLALEYLIEVLFANSFANLTEDHAKRLTGMIVRMDGDLGTVLTIETFKPAQKLVALVLSRATERANKIRARVDSLSGGTKQ